VDTFFTSDAPLIESRAPGRLDVMGGIADYSGALVLQLPLDRVATVTLQRQASPRCDIASCRAEGWSHFGIELAGLVDGPLADPNVLRSWFAQRTSDRWAAYVVGVVQFCLRRIPDLRDLELPGLRLRIESTVPEGKGVSSSAALEVATMAAVSHSYGLAIPAYEMAVACQWVENHVVGAPCGIMDQMTSACGRRDRLLRLRCQPGTIEGYSEIPSGYRFYGIDSGVRHAVTGADYETVRTGAFMGYRVIADLAGLQVERDGDRVVVDDPYWRGYLANIPLAEFETRFHAALPKQMSGREFLDRYAGITDTVTRVRPDRWYPVQQATAHPIYEQHRVERFATMLEQLGDRPELALNLGQLMHASHASYGGCGLGSDATDRLVELVATAGAESGLFGAKITGGGSGGTVAILGTADAEPEVRAVARRYSAETGRPTELFTQSGPGAEEMGVRRLA
jgi:galactokinase